MWEGIELREIRTFLVLAEELHFGRAARRLYLSPSRVSQSLRELEAKIDGQLVYRTSRRVELTALGERFRDEVGAAHEQLVGVLERTRDGDGGLEGAVRLGLLTPSIEGPRLPSIAQTFERRHTGCRVEVSKTPYEDSFGPLRRGEIDLMVSWLPHGQPDLEHGPVVNREPRVLAVAREHPLAKSSVSIEEIADYVVVPLEELFPAEIAETLIPSKTPGGRLIPRLRVPYGELARRDPSNVRTQLSWWITTGQVVHPTVPSAEALLGTNIVYAPIVDMAPMEAALVWPRAAQNPRAQAFVRVARQVTRGGGGGERRSVEGRRTSAARGSDTRSR
jgi:DNA-binding transcriptional LysR family regulator